MSNNLIPVLKVRERQYKDFFGMVSWEYIEEAALMFSLLGLCAFYSASETAYSAIDKNVLNAMKKANKFGAKQAVKLSENFDFVLSSILIGNTVVCIALSSVGAVVFGDIVKNDEYGAAISGALLTILILMFGEISPKLLAKDAAEKLACLLAWPLYILTWLMTPLCYLVSLWKTLLLKTFKLNQKKNNAGE